MLRCAPIRRRAPAAGGCPGKEKAMPIKVEKPTEQQVAAMRGCPTWSKEVSSFDWTYDAPETCYLLAGDVVVTTEDGQVVTFGAGDLVTFPAGLTCRWEVRQPVHKHYRMG
jgi:uncharacterized cupin superfamily protein